MILRIVIVFYPFLHRFWRGLLPCLPPVLYSSLPTLLTLKRSSSARIPVSFGSASPCCRGAVSAAAAPGARGHSGHSSSPGGVCGHPARPAGRLAAGGGGGAEVGAVDSGWGGGGCWLTRPAVCWAAGGVSAAPRYFPVMDECAIPIVPVVKSDVFGFMVCGRGLCSVSIVGRGLMSVSPQIVAPRKCKSVPMLYPRHIKVKVVVSYR